MTVILIVGMNIVTIGDWGTDLTDEADLVVQKGVARKMNEFYEKQKANGYNLLMVLALGDKYVKYVNIHVC